MDNESRVVWAVWIHLNGTTPDADVIQVQGRSEDWCLGYAEGFNTLGWYPGMTAYVGPVKEDL